MHFAVFAYDDFHPLFTGIRDERDFYVTVVLVVLCESLHLLQALFAFRSVNLVRAHSQLLDVRVIARYLRLRRAIEGNAQIVIEIDVGSNCAHSRRVIHFSFRI